MLPNESIEITSNNDIGDKELKKLQIFKLNDYLSD